MRRCLSAPKYFDIVSLLRWLCFDDDDIRRGHMTLRRQCLVCFTHRALGKLIDLRPAMRTYAVRVLSELSPPLSSSLC